MLMDLVTSTANEKVRFMRALDEAKARRASGLMRVEGRKLCLEAANALRVDTLFVDADKIGEYATLMDQCLAQGAAVYPVAARVIHYASEAKTPQDVVLSAHIPQRPLGEGPLVALDGVQDPGNCGTVIRTCDAAGLGGVILGAGCADPYAPKAVRATMGSLFRVPLIKVPDLAEYLAARRAEGRAVVVSALDGEDFYTRDPLPQDLILVIGSEGRGVSPAVAACATHRFRLPMAGGSESLNASVAAGILIYDLFREFRYGR